MNNLLIRACWSVSGFLTLVMLFTFSPTCLSQVPDQEKSDVIRIDVDLVTINVSVHDRKGHNLSGLKPDHFLVTESDKPVTLEGFDSEGPASIVFVIDISSSMRSLWKTVALGMKKFLDSSSSANDYTLVVFGDRPKLLVESVNAAELTRVIKELKPDGETAMYDGVIIGLETLRRVPQRRKALVLISDGLDTKSQKDLGDVEEETSEARTTIYAIGIELGRWCQPITPEFCQGRDILRYLANETGGVGIFPDSSTFAGTLKDVAAEIASQYSLSYYSQDKKPGWRRVRVSVANSGRQPVLQYQQSYFRK